MHVKNLLLWLLLPCLFCSCQAVHPGDTVLPDTALRRIWITRVTMTPHSVSSRTLADVSGDTPEARKLIDQLWEQHHAAFPETELKSRLPVPVRDYTQIVIMHGRDIDNGSSYQKLPGTPPSSFEANPAARERFRVSFDAVSDAVMQFQRRMKQP